MAWASERKDVLSAFFGLLTMLAYVSYVKTKSKASYLLALGCFVLGLMSKPMLVTLPFVLLLIDYWPLQRGQAFQPKTTDPLASDAIAPDAAEQPALWTMRWLRLIAEKLPFFALALLASAVTYLVQQHAGAMSSLEELPFRERIANAALAYFQYLSKAIWPAGLAIFYPFQHHPPMGMVVLSLGALASLSCLFVAAAKRRPYLFTGWFWFVGMLVPTIGLVQVGSQALADRYMYLPSIGLFGAIIWGLDDFLSGWPASRRVLPAAAAIALAGCLAATLVQIGYWRDSERLFGHALEVTQDNYVAYNGLGGALDVRSSAGSGHVQLLDGRADQPALPRGSIQSGHRVAG